jgi:hypothetical protein
LRTTHKVSGKKKEEEERERRRVREWVAGTD